MHIETSQEIVTLRRKIFSLSAENARLQTTISYQLGQAILQAGHWRGLLALPGELLRLVSASRHRRGHRPANDAAHPSLDQLVHRLLGRSEDAGADEIIAALAADFQPRQQAMMLTEVAGMFQITDPAKSLELLRHAAHLDPTPKRQVRVADTLYDGGAIEEPRAIYSALTSRRALLSQKGKQRADVLEGMARIRDTGLKLPAKAPRRKKPSSELAGILYVAASSMPYQTTGYTTRTQALLTAIGSEGWRVEAVTRPGYPWDRNDIHHAPQGRVQQVGEVTYTLLAGPKSNAMPFDRYCTDAAKVISAQIEATRPALIHAASNYVNAMPALFAARRAGLPFVYEVRGLWELTHAAKDPGFDKSERFEWQKAQETKVAKAADLVVTISEGLKRELVERGVSADRIILAPNCVDPTLFKPTPKKEALAERLVLGDATVLGFIGSITNYEGLVDLVSVIGELRNRGHDVCALLVGDGPAAEEVRQAARAFGVQRHVIMPGRVAHSEVADWYSVIDVAVYPRRPSRVTELVPPLKPLEAMAMGIPVVASNVSAIRESIVHDHNGFLFERGDPQSLLTVLDEVLSDPVRARKVAEQGLEDVTNKFNWTTIARRLGAAYNTQIDG